MYELCLRSRMQGNGGSLESVGWLSGFLRACGARLGLRNRIPILRVLAELARSEVSCSPGFRLKSLRLAKMI